MQRADILTQFAVNDFYELDQLFMKHDQAQVKNNTFDIFSTLAVNNQIKDALLNTNLESLSEYDKDVAQGILWLWYHHACTVAIWQLSDLDLAKDLCEEALSYMREGHPNKMTYLIWLLVQNKIDDAQKWYQQEVNENEDQYAQMLFTEYTKGTFNS